MNGIVQTIKNRVRATFSNAPPYTHRQFTKEIRSHGFRIGPNTYGHVKLRWWGDNAILIIGDYCSLAEVEIFLGGAHRADWNSTYPFPAFPRRFPEVAGVTDFVTTHGNVVIGSDVWIATRAMIMSGVTIGHGAVVAARSVVTRDVPPYAIVAGSPAKVIKYRFPPELIDRFLRLAWWEFDRDQLGSLLPLMVTNRIEEFLTAGEAVRAGQEASL